MMTETEKEIYERSLLEEHNRYVFIDTLFSKYWKEQFRKKPTWNTLKRFLQQ